MRLFCLQTVGSFLLTVELLRLQWCLDLVCLQLELFSLTVGVSLLTTEVFLHAM